MSEDLEPLKLDLVEWVARYPRRYSEVIDAWRTSCPRLPVLEDAFDDGYLVRERRQGASPMVAITPAGRRFLKKNGRRPAKLGATTT